MLEGLKEEAMSSLCDNMKRFMFPSDRSSSLVTEWLLSVAQIQPRFANFDLVENPDYDETVSNSSIFT